MTTATHSTQFSGSKPSAFATWAHADQSAGAPVLSLRRLQQWLGTMLLCCGLASITTQAQEGPIVIDKDARVQIIKVQMEGLKGEADSVVRFDLEVAGFDFVGAADAQYLIRGKSEANVIGQVNDKITGAPVLAPTSYNGATIRSQAHKFAGDIIEKLRGIKSITATRIAFKVDTGPTSEIYVSDYDGHSPIQITQDRNIVAAPCWASGKRAIYYTSYLKDNPDIYLQDLSTGSRKIVARYSGLNTSAASSPDGSKLAMILSKGGSPDVYVSNADGTGLRRLTDTKEDESSPCWSPDGRKICFVSRLTGRRALYVIGVEGGQMQRIRTDGISNPSEPDWSPDGKKIIFTAQMGNFNICTVDAGGGVAEILTQGEDPSWSPNSRTVVFTRRVRGKRILSLLDVPTKRVKDVQQVSGSSSQPSWAK